jgi:hypothetical protein
MKDLRTALLGHVEVEMRFACRHVAGTVLVAAALLVGCKKSSTAPSAPTVTNQADNFSYQTPHYDGHTGTESYAWTNTGTSADVTQSSSLSSGFATILIRDGAATQVYQATLSTPGMVQTTVGVAGTWTIQVDYANAKGTVGFTVKKH